MTKQDIKYDLIKEKYLAADRLVNKIFLITGTVIIPVFILIRDELKDSFSNVAKSLLQFYIFLLGQTLGSLLFIITMVMLIPIIGILSYKVTTTLTKIIEQHHRNHLKKFQKEVKEKILKEKVG